MARNPGVNFDAEYFKHSTTDAPSVEEYVSSLLAEKKLTEDCQIAHLVKAVTCLDLTTLCGDDTANTVKRLCYKAAHPIQRELLAELGIKFDGFSTAAVCVYPARVADAVGALSEVKAEIPVASVAGGFPSGQYHLKTRLLEIECAIEDGAKEIDIVIDRSLALTGKWEELYNEVKKMKAICGTNVPLKSIIAAGELGSLTNVYKASMVCMMAGVDFIKTSTGKEVVNATLPIGVTMCRAIKDYLLRTGYKVGFKPAGGIRTVKDVISWQILMREELGKEWLEPDLFRIGASSLLGVIEEHISKFVASHMHQIPHLPTFDFSCLSTS